MIAYWIAGGIPLAILVAFIVLGLDGRKERRLERRRREFLRLRSLEDEPPC